MREDYDYDMNEKFTINQIEHILGWDGFVDPEGNFYPTKPTACDYYKGSYNAHLDWATQYVEDVLNIGDVNSKLKSMVSSGEINTDGLPSIYGCCLSGVKDYMVEVLGWCSIGYSNMMGRAYTCTPDPTYCGRDVTEAQKKLVFEIYKGNGYDMDEYFRQFEGLIKTRATYMLDDVTYNGGDLIDLVDELHNLKEEESDEEEARRKDYD